MVSGAVTGKFDETPDSSSSCQTNASGITQGTIVFSSPTDTFKFQLSLPAGSTTFPNTKANALIAFYNTSDSKMEWSAGTTTQPGRGTVSLTGKKGTVSATLGYSPPSSTQPALGPVTVSGTFTCP
jgi:hypothetical protein